MLKKFTFVMFIALTLVLSACASNRNENNGEATSPFGVSTSAFNQGTTTPAISGSPSPSSALASPSAASTGTAAVPVTGATGTPSFNSTPMTGTGTPMMTGTMGASLCPTTTGTPAVTATSSYGSTTPAASPSVPMTTPTPPTGPAELDLCNNTTLGDYLVDGKGMTLYIFMKDTQNSTTSACTDTCAAIWPPFLTKGDPTIGQFNQPTNGGQGIQQSMIGTITRADGSTQVTYNGWPLYYFNQDKNPGDVGGEGMFNQWYVITPTGEKK